MLAFRWRHISTTPNINIKLFILFFTRKTNFRPEEEVARK